MWTCGKASLKVKAVPMSSSEQFGPGAGKHEVIWHSHEAQVWKAKIELSCFLRNTCKTFHVLLFSVSAPTTSGLYTIFPHQWQILYVQSNKPKIGHKLYFERNSVFSPGHSDGFIHCDQLTSLLLLVEHGRLNGEGCTGAYYWPSPGKSYNKHST